MKILLVGDTHGNPAGIIYAFSAATFLDCDRIVQLGDFGYWEHKQGGGEFLDLVSELAQTHDVPFYWIDGNHENHTKLRKEYASENTFWTIRNGLFYIPRGTRFTWGGTRFMGFGGAYSIDRGWRKIGESWWWEEEITDEEVEAAIADPEPIDVLLSHDVPSGVDMRLMMARRGFDYKNIPASEKGRMQLRKVVNAVRPSHVFHGHYHVNYRQEVDYGYGPVKVTGLNCDESGTESIYVLDTGAIV